MKSNARRRSAEDEEIGGAQKTSNGARFPRETESTTVETLQHESAFPDVGESTPIPNRPPETPLDRCPRCGMERAGRAGHAGQGVSDNRGLRYCCAGCAKGTGCTCTDEQRRHTGENVGKSR